MTVKMKIDEILQSYASIIDIEEWEEYNNLLKDLNELFLEIK